MRSGFVGFHDVLNCRGHAELRECSAGHRMVGVDGRTPRVKDFPWAGWYANLCGLPSRLRARVGESDGASSRATRERAAGEVGKGGRTLPSRLTAGETRRDDDTNRDGGFPHSGKKREWVNRK